MKKRMQKLFTVMLIISVMMSMMSISTYAAEPVPELEFICEKEAHVHCWWKCKFMQALWKTVWRFLKK